MQFSFLFLFFIFFYAKINENFAFQYRIFIIFNSFYNSFLDDFNI